MKESHTQLLNKNIESENGSNLTCVMCTKCARAQCAIAIELIRLTSISSVCLLACSLLIFTRTDLNTVVFFLFISRMGSSMMISLSLSFALLFCPWPYLNNKYSCAKTQYIYVSCYQQPTQQTSQYDDTLWTIAITITGCVQIVYMDSSVWFAHARALVLFCFCMCWCTRVYKSHLAFRTA